MILSPSATGRLVRCLRPRVRVQRARVCLTTPPAPTSPPPPPPDPSMSLSGSSGKKVLESPFSRAQIYGQEQPANSPAGRRKAKGSKGKRSVTSSADERPAVKHKPKKRRGSKGGSSAPSILPTRNRAHKGTSPAAFSLAQVDSDPHSPSKKPTYRKTNPISPQHHGTNKQTVGANKQTTASRYVQTTETPELSSTSEVDKKETTTSLLSFSRMSTSELILSMCNGHQARVGGVASTGEGVASGNRRSKNKHGTGGGLTTMPPHTGGLILPPHMRVPRQAFTTSQGRGGLGGVAHKKGEGLDVREIGRRLGRLLYKRIIVMSGAGVSTSSGIPDFRSVSYRELARTCANCTTVGHR